MKNTVVWSLTFTGKIPEEPVFDAFEMVMKKIKEDVFNVFVYGKTDISSSKDFIEYLQKTFDRELIWYDISISTEDKIFLSQEHVLTWNYYFTTYQGFWKNFHNILAEVQTWGIHKNDKVIAIREAEESKMFPWERVIKVDILG